MNVETVVTLPALDVRAELREGFVVDTDRARLDLGQVHEWLSLDAYWAMGRSREVVDRAADASINFGVYDAGGVQVGYARVVTDGVTFGWLCDVYIAREARGLGLGTALSRVVVDAVRPLNLKRFMLATSDAHEVYSKAGFDSVPEPDTMMVLGSDES